MVKKFKDVGSLLSYVAKSSKGGILNGKNVERYLAAEMSKAVQRYVYDVYEPKSYIRRASNGGLSDMRNMIITGVNVIGNRINVQFENLTEGNDNLSGNYISDLIEFGEGTNGKHWTVAGGRYSEPRRFAEGTKNDINMDILVKCLKADLAKKGFNFK